MELSVLCGAQTPKTLDVSQFDIADSPRASVLQRHTVFLRPRLRLRSQDPGVHTRSACVVSGVCLDCRLCSFDTSIAGAALHPEEDAAVRILSSRMPLAAWAM